MDLQFCGLFGEKRDLGWEGGSIGYCGKKGVWRGQEGDGGEKIV